MILRTLLSVFLLFTLTAQAQELPGRWSAEKANDWYAQQEWLVGCNFTPSTAINQIEFWAEETFDPETIDRELGWAADIGFNTVRVYLHYLVWARSPQGLKDRINHYLEIADSHDISTMFVLFDDCWNDNPNLGKQPEPEPWAHNPGWVRCPGGLEQVQDEALYPVLEAYTKDLIGAFGDDERVIVWDLYNEPGNSGHLNNSLPLLKKIFRWAREAAPSQPLTVGIWYESDDYADLNEFQLANSDVITFHNYGPREQVLGVIARLEPYGRPLICTEYMARTRDCTFESHLPVFKEHNIGAYNWGLVSGKTQTIYPWRNEEPGEPEVWFHDILRKDGTPFDQAEIELIKELTGR